MSLHMALLDKLWCCHPRLFMVICIRARGLFSSSSSSSSSSFLFYSSFPLLPFCFVICAASTLDRTRHFLKSSEDPSAELPRFRNSGSVSRQYLRSADGSTSHSHSPTSEASDESFHDVTQRASRNNRSSFCSFVSHRFCSAQSFELRRLTVAKPVAYP